MTRAQMTDPELEELADRAAPLDVLLVDAALGPVRRLAPNSARRDRYLIVCLGEAVMNTSTRLDRRVSPRPRLGCTRSP
jgi:hypothetical protein